jgi:hypothetical protein
MRGNDLNVNPGCRRAASHPTSSNQPTTTNRNQPQPTNRSQRRRPGRGPRTAIPPRPRRNVLPAGRRRPIDLRQPKDDRPAGPRLMMPAGAVRGP